MAELPRIATFAFDCPDPGNSADFWCDFLGYEIQHSDDDWVQLVDPRGGPAIALQLAPDFTPPLWPQHSSLQVHLDLTVRDIWTVHDRAIELGARAVEPTAPPADVENRAFRVYAAPDGHLFCLCQPGSEVWRR